MPSIDPALLKSAREQAGLSREFVAITFSRSYHAVRSWESGQACPPGDVLVQLAALYRVPVEALCADPDPAGAR